MRSVIVVAIVVVSVGFWFWERSNPSVSAPEPIDREAVDAVLTPLVVSGVIQWAEADTASVGVSGAFLDASDAQQREWLGPAYRVLGPLSVHAATGERIGTFDSRGLTLRAERHPPEAAGDSHVHRVETPAGAAPQ